MLGLGVSQGFGRLAGFWDGGFRVFGGVGVVGFAVGGSGLHRSVRIGLPLT